MIAAVLIVKSFIPSKNPAYAPFYEPDNLSRNELSGVWKLSAASFDLLKSYLPNGVTNVILDLKTNRELVITNFPLDVGAAHSALSQISGVGNWDVEREYAAFRVSISINGQGNNLDVRTFQRRIILTETLEDPDSGKLLVFERD